MYVADYFNNAIRMINSNGSVITLTGNGIEVLSDGINSSTIFYRPSGLAVDSNGTVYVADNGYIRKIQFDHSSLLFATLKGSSSSVIDSKSTNTALNGNGGINFRFRGIKSLIITFFIVVILK